MRRVVALLLVATLAGCQPTDKLHEAADAANRAVKNAAQRGRSGVENMLRNALPW